MRRSDVLDLLTAHAARLCDRHGLRSLALFGSVARDEAQPGSDVDILVDFEGPVDLFRFMACRFDLEALLDAPVDLVMASAIKASRQPFIEREMLRVA
jgi:predicted nucleotidyltransferase